MLSDIDKERIEAASLRAWPALEETALEHWRLRFSDGFTGRANSVQTAAGATSPVSSRVASCEEWYTKRGLPCTFRLMHFSEPGLDQFLAYRGYERVKLSDVLWSEATSLASPRLSGSLRSLQPKHWVQTFASLSELPGEPPPAFSRIVGSIPPPALFAVLMDESEKRPVACGLAVADGHLVGLFDLVVAKDVRRRGYGAQLVQRLAGWGVDRGARQTYLQVQQDNAPASHLYRKLGFQPAYQYWYRARTT